MILPTAPKLQFFVVLSSLSFCDIFSFETESSSLIRRERVGVRVVGADESDPSLRSLGDSVSFLICFIVRTKKIPLK